MIKKKWKKMYIMIEQTYVFCEVKGEKNYYVFSDVMIVLLILMIWIFLEFAVGHFHFSAKNYVS
jgi:hypothetical protein